MSIFGAQNVNFIPADIGSEDNPYDGSEFLFENNANRNSIYGQNNICVRNGVVHLAVTIPLAADLESLSVREIFKPADPFRSSLELLVRILISIAYTASRFPTSISDDFRFCFVDLPTEKGWEQKEGGGSRGSHYGIATSNVCARMLLLMFAAEHVPLVQQWVADIISSNELMENKQHLTPGIMRLLNSSLQADEEDADEMLVEETPSNTRRRGSSNMAMGNVQKNPLMKGINRTKLYIALSLYYDKHITSSDVTEFCVPGSTDYFPDPLDFLSCERAWGVVQRFCRGKYFKLTTHINTLEDILGHSTTEPFPRPKFIYRLPLYQTSIDIFPFLIYPGQMEVAESVDALKSLQRRQENNEFQLSLEPGQSTEKALQDIMRILNMRLHNPGDLQCCEDSSDDDGDTKAVYGLNPLIAVRYDIVEPYLEMIDKHLKEQGWEEKIPQYKSSIRTQLALQVWKSFMSPANADILPPSIVGLTTYLRDKVISDGHIFVFNQSGSSVCLGVVQNHFLNRLQMYERLGLAINHHIMELMFQMACACMDFESMDRYPLVNVLLMISGPGLGKSLLMNLVRMMMPPGVTKKKGSSSEMASQYSRLLQDAMNVHIHEEMDPNIFGLPQDGKRFVDNRSESKAKDWATTACMIHDTVENVISPNGKESKQTVMKRVVKGLTVFVAANDEQKTSVAMRSRYMQLSVHGSEVREKDGDGHNVQSSKIRPLLKSDEDFHIVRNEINDKFQSISTAAMIHTLLKTAGVTIHASELPAAVARSIVFDYFNSEGIADTSSVNRSADTFMKLCLYVHSLHVAHTIMGYRTIADDLFSQSGGYNFNFGDFISGQYIPVSTTCVIQMLDYFVNSMVPPVHMDLRNYVLQTLGYVSSKYNAEVTIPQDTDSIDCSRQRVLLSLDTAIRDPFYVGIQFPMTNEKCGILTQVAIYLKAELQTSFLESEIMSALKNLCGQKMSVRNYRPPHVMAKVFQGEISRESTMPDKPIPRPILKIESFTLNENGVKVSYIQVAVLKLWLNHSNLVNKLYKKVSAYEGMRQWKCPDLLFNDELEMNVARAVADRTSKLLKPILSEIKDTVDRSAQSLSKIYQNKYGEKNQKLTPKQESKLRRKTGMSNDLTVLLNGTQPLMWSLLFPGENKWLPTLFKLQMDAIQEQYECRFREAQTASMEAGEEVDTNAEPGYAPGLIWLDDEKECVYFNIPAVDVIQDLVCRELMTKSELVDIFKYRLDSKGRAKETKQSRKNLEEFVNRVANKAIHVYQDTGEMPEDIFLPCQHRVDRPLFGFDEDTGVFYVNYSVYGFCMSYAECIATGSIPYAPYITGVCVPKRKDKGFVVSEHEVASMINGSDEVLSNKSGTIVGESIRDNLEHIAIINTQKQLGHEEVPVQAFTEVMEYRERAWFRKHPEEFRTVYGERLACHPFCDFPERHSQGLLQMETRANNFTRWREAENKKAKEMIARFCDQEMVDHRAFMRSTPSVRQVDAELKQSIIAVNATQNTDNRTPFLTTNTNTQRSRRNEASTSGVAETASRLTQQSPRVSNISRKRTMSDVENEEVEVLDILGSYVQQSQCLTVNPKDNWRNASNDLYYAMQQSQYDQPRKRAIIRTNLDS